MSNPKTARRTNSLERIPGDLEAAVFCDAGPIINESKI
jgi:hypothetical protein